MELVAEGDDELMEEFFEKGTIPEEHLVPALHNAIREDKLFPVLFASGLGNIGADELLDFIVDYTPAASEHHAITEWTAARHQRRARRSAKSRITSRLLALRLQDLSRSVRRAHLLLQGVFRRAEERRHAAELHPQQRRKSSRTSPSCRARTAVPVTELHAGDIGAVAKLKETLTGDTLGDKISADPVSRGDSCPSRPSPSPSSPRRRADEDKLGVGIHKLMEEDAMLRFFRDPQTKEFLIAGTGQQHIEVVVSKLKNRYHTEVVLKAPESSVPRNHSRQGRRAGTPQEADRRPRPVSATAKLRWSRCRAAEVEFEFVNDIFGGAIPQELYSRG